MAQVAVSLIGANQLNFSDEIKRVENADYLHYDVMDGHFVPNITLGTKLFEQIRETFPNMKVEVHLLVQEPEKFIPLFTNPFCIIVHPSTVKSIPTIIQLIKEQNSKVGFALNPDEEFDTIDSYVSQTDLIVVMGTFGGFSGRKLLPETYGKIKNIRKRYKGLIEIDCGVDEFTAEDLVKAGADILLSGSYLFKENTKERLLQLKSL